MCILPGLLHFTSTYGFPKLNAVYSLTKIKYGQEVFKWTFLPVELERGSKTLQFDVCCEAIHQNFDCGCVLKKGYANLQIQTKKLQYRKFGIAGLKSSLKATEKYAYCLGYLHFTSRYGFPTTYHFYLKSS